MYAVLHLILLAVTCGVLAASWVTRDEVVMWVSVGLFGLGEIAGTIALAYRVYSDGRLPASESPRRSTLQRVDSKAWGWLTASGILIGLTGLLAQNEVMGASGLLLWIVGVGFYALCGVLVSVIADVPMRMTYGGWKVRGRR